MELAENILQNLGNDLMADSVQYHKSRLKTSIHLLSHPGPGRSQVRLSEGHIWQEGRQAQGGPGIPRSGGQGTQFDSSDSQFLILHHYYM